MNPKVIQVGGTHYQHPKPALDIIVDYDIPFTGGCILKYLVRAHNKGCTQDIDKAISLVPVYFKQLRKADKDLAVPPWVVDDYFKQNHGYLHPAAKPAITELFKLTPATERLLKALEEFKCVLQYEDDTYPDAVK